jgi:hypothetical protein
VIPTFLAGQNLPGVGSEDGHAYDHASTLRDLACRGDENR